MTEEKILEIKGLSAGYGSGRAIADVSLSLRRGEILCVAGESGCGKSTLLKAVQGMEPGLRILAGTVSLEGTDLSTLPEKERRKRSAEKIGMVLQNPGGAFNPIRSYRKQFIETLRSRGLYDPAAAAGGTRAHPGLLSL